MVLVEAASLPVLDLEWVKGAVTLPGYRPDQWIKTNEEVVKDFLRSTEQACLCFAVENDDLVVERYAGPSILRYERIMFLIKVPIGKDSDASSVQIFTGTLSLGADDSFQQLFSLVSRVVSPTILAGKSYNTNQKNEVLSLFHKFMSTLTDYGNHTKHRTKLYIPLEVIPDSVQASEHKDLVQRLESMIIHWARQIKEVVSNIGEQGNSSEGGPLEEISFWQVRKVDLLGISKQIKCAEVQKILRFLRSAESSYVEPFLEYSKKIDEGAKEATNIVNFLQILLEPCEKLYASKPRSIPSILPQIFHCVRFIWTHSENFNNFERLCQLLGKICNLAILRCKASLSRDDLFSGSIQENIDLLNDCVRCGDSWRKSFSETAAAIAFEKKFKCQPWKFDTAAIFAPFDAFVQRCRDFHEICRSRSQFDTDSLIHAVFEGTRGPEIEKTLRDIGSTFQEHLRKLKYVKYDIFDVNASAWRGDFRLFRTRVKDVEVRLQNAISSSLGDVSEVPKGIQILCGFYSMAKIDSIHNVLEKKTSELYCLFERNVQKVRHDFDMKRKDDYRENSDPTFAGSARWCLSLAQSVRDEWDLIHSSVESFLPKTKEYTIAEGAFMQLISALHAYVAQRHEAWVASLQALSVEGLSNRLQNTCLLRRMEGAHSEAVAQGTKLASLLVECNFDPLLLATFDEVFYWSQFQGQGRFSIPYIAHDIYNRKNKLLTARAHVMSVVRAFNDLIGHIAGDDVKLMTDQLRMLEKKISPGLRHLNWGSRGMIDLFVKECFKKIREVEILVKKFNAAKQFIHRKCDQIVSALFLVLGKNHEFEKGALELVHGQHCEQMRKVVKTHFDDICKTVDELAVHFCESFTDMKKEWRQFLRKVDSRIGHALLTNVKRSLAEFSKAVNGDPRCEPRPIFRVAVSLHGDKIGFSPSPDELTVTVKQICKNILLCTDAVGFISKSSHQVMIKDAGAAFGNEGKTHAKRCYSEIIGNDSEIERLTDKIIKGVMSNSEAIEKYVLYWEKYRSVCVADKKRFIRKYAELRPSPQTFQNDISRYREIGAEINAEAVCNAVNCIKIDFALIKDALMNHSLEWQNQLTNLFKERCSEELDSFVTTIENTSLRLKEKPATVEELQTSLLLLKQAEENSTTQETKLKMVQEMFCILKKYEVQVSEPERLMLEQLPQSWVSFEEVKHQAKAILADAKSTLKKRCEQEISQHSVAVTKMVATTRESLPLSSSVTPTSALESLANFKLKIEQLKAKNDLLAEGLKVVQVPMDRNTDIDDLQAFISDVEAVWSQAKAWQEFWAAIQGITFEKIDLEEIRTQCAETRKHLLQFGGASRRCDIWQVTHDQVCQFQKLSTLIECLRSEAIRPRHWDEIRALTNVNFDPHHEEFTLHKVFSIGLHLHEETILEITSSAQKELALERMLRTIEKHWEKIEFTITTYKDSYVKITTSEEFSTTLEDHQMAIAGMKASKSSCSFVAEIKHWEHAFSLISEIIELFVQVQRQWLYLESIFASSEDIQKQLPAETRMFEEVNERYVGFTRKVILQPVIKTVCEREETLPSLLAMSDDLERIQHGLDEYLETKRMLFPRFYFLSNDDLLEILGHSKEPAKVQCHMKKCFEGVKYMKVEEKTEKSGEKISHISGLIAPDGEEVTLNTAIQASGAVESWLCKVEDMMKKSLQKLLAESIAAHRGKKEKWIKEWQGQLLITTGQVMWSNGCQKALIEISKGVKNALRMTRRKQIAYLKRLSDMIREKLVLVERSKLVALITCEIHSRDVIEKMIKISCESVTDFEWLSQLRLSFDREQGEYGFCQARQLNATLDYGYEYQGNNGRLVITPLTDRCVLTLVMAMWYKRGGNPLGPAGTGKTETVKDLGKNLGKYVIVVNCSDGLDYKSVGRMFCGLAQSGAWGCFDEFNRIDVEVLSVVATQIDFILSAQSQGVSHFNFMGKNIKCDMSCGIFITMNPGYAGRSELPENLKALMRPVAMMVPDLALIAEVILQAEGFQDSRHLSRKIVTLYNLMIQQLSKQDHYDYGLRNLKAVLSCAGTLKRQQPYKDEDSLLLTALVTMNLPKFIKDDKELFLLLLNDLFPSYEVQKYESTELAQEIEKQLEAQHLPVTPAFVGKVIELDDSKRTRHSNMLVGESLSGKSTIWNVLLKAKNALIASDHNGKDDESGRVFIINPKALSLNEIYGVYDMTTFEWADGILSSLFRSCSESTRQGEQWIVFDGPVDTFWIESMNSVMDDNRILTLINGDRISMTSSMSLLFEVDNLSAASPATVSRAGMIYVDSTVVVQENLLEFLLHEGHGDMLGYTDVIRKLCHKYLLPTLHFRMTKKIEEAFQTSKKGLIITFFRLLNSFVASTSSLKETQEFPKLLEKGLIFCVIWAVMSAANEQGRALYDAFLRDIDPQLPPVQSIFEYMVDTKKAEWDSWQNKVPHWRPKKDVTLSRMIVPTLDTVRLSYVLSLLTDHKQQSLIVGGSGTGKTTLMLQVLRSLPSDKFSTESLTLTAATKASSLQEQIESFLEKKSNKALRPPGNRHLVVFIDDMGMPDKDEFGSQPPLELIRQLIDYQGLYDRKRCHWKSISNTVIAGALSQASASVGGISRRLLNCFFLLNQLPPDSSQMQKIFSSLLMERFVDCDTDIKSIIDSLVQSTIEVYHRVKAIFLPTPGRSHYLFSMRDILKVIQGFYFSAKRFADNKEGLVSIWIHEISRVFGDRLLVQDGNDVTRFQDIVSDISGPRFEETFGTLATKIEMVGGLPVMYPFGSSVSTKELEYDVDLGPDEARSLLSSKLELYNSEPNATVLDLVLFSDAMSHLARICRMLKLPQGHGLLVGFGGSGRQTLCAFSAYLSGYTMKQVKITKAYRVTDFLEDLRDIYRQCGLEGDKILLFLRDDQLRESFLEIVNNILDTGIVPGMYAKEELASLVEEVQQQENLGDMPPKAVFQLFVDRVCERLRVVIAMSPVGQSFTHYCRKFPALVSCTTINWFHAWPQDALCEVACKFLKNAAAIPSEEVQRLSLLFASSHRQVEVVSSFMWSASHRRNFITPTNFITSVKSFKEILVKKKQELYSWRDKLMNGLEKLEEAKASVQKMTVVLENKKIVIAENQKECEDLLVVIVAERRAAGDQKKLVEAESARIANEEQECKRIAGDAQKDLNRALPALEKAMEDVDKLDKSAISEVKAYSKPPKPVETVLSAVMILFGLKADWNTAKKKISEPHFLQDVKSFNKDNVPTSILSKIKKYIEDPGFNPEAVMKVSSAAAALCSWVCAMYVYAGVCREVEPKRERLRGAEESLREKQKSFQVSRDKLEGIIKAVDRLKAQYDSSIEQKNGLKKEADDLEVKLHRAADLVTGLSGEYKRWQETVQALETSLLTVFGDSFLGASFISYCGPFEAPFRKELTSRWAADVQKAGISIAEDLSISSFLSTPTEVRTWNQQGLPTDEFSVENGIICTKSSRWPLIIDPQGQACKWIKNREGKGLIVLNPGMGDYLRKLESAIQYGSRVLLESVGEELDSSLDPILSKSVVKSAGGTFVSVGDKRVEYNFDFRLFLTTKLSNPEFSPETSAKVAIINFSLTKRGLVEQLLGIVVQKEEPSLEHQKNELTIQIANGNAQLDKLEDEILRLLSCSKGSLLDDESLVKALKDSKSTAQDVSHQLDVASETKQRIDLARDGYRIAATRAAVIYFVLEDLRKVDPMYQYSLDWYIDLFKTSIESSRGVGSVQDLSGRNREINSYHTVCAFQTTCTGLFERHRLLLSFHLCCRILEEEGMLHVAEYKLFLFGEKLLDPSIVISKDFPSWLDSITWKRINTLEMEPSFNGMMTSLEQNSRDWKAWFMSAKPEDEPLPDEWEANCNDLQKMLIVRSLRPDRVSFAAKRFVSSNLGPEIAETSSFDLEYCFERSTPRTPFIFILSPGADPTIQVSKLAASYDARLQICALGQGQAHVAETALESAVEDGHWLFLSNCHLMMSWMVTLEKIIQNLVSRSMIHKNFRLWLSSAPHPKFPISILQCGLKVTTEPPRGVKENLVQVYNSISPEKFDASEHPTKYKRLLFALAWFHAILIERRKFQSLGWNIVYDFNLADFSICNDLLSSLIDEYPERVPFSALRYLIAEAYYGGRVTDSVDRRLVRVYINQYFCNEAVEVDDFKLSSLEEYHIPKDETLAGVKEYIRGLPSFENASIFGQHTNADISSQTEEADSLLNALISLQPGESTAVDISGKEKLLASVKSLLETLPRRFSVVESKIALEKRPDAAPLKIVLFQEVERYNQLLETVQESLVQVQAVVEGFAGMSPDIEQVMHSIMTGKVPQKWSFCYPSVKPLGSWMEDLNLRCDQFRDWIEKKQPEVFWLPGFTYPSAFLTAVLQCSARRSGLSIDTFSWEFHVRHQNGQDASGRGLQRAIEGQYISGLILEGAHWDVESNHLTESKPLELYCPMPVINFKPVEARRKQQKALYNCPMYMYPVKTGTRERPSFIMGVDLKAGDHLPEFWCKRGTCLLLQLGN